MEEKGLGIVCKKKSAKKKQKQKNDHYRKKTKKCVFKSIYNYQVSNSHLLHKLTPATGLEPTTTYFVNEHSTI